jgi:putative transposase
VGYSLTREGMSKGVLPDQLPALDRVPQGTFVHQFNHERPHQALDMATPASRYQPSARAYQGVGELEYPRHDWTAVIHHLRAYLLPAPQGQRQPGVCGSEGRRQTDRGQHLARNVYGLRLGVFDDETCRLEPIDNPFGSKLLPMSPE